MEPQLAWSTDGVAQIDWFDVASPNTKAQLEQRPELVKVVNLEEGDEADFVRADPVLRLGQSAEGVAGNVLVPTRAKGLEFPAVVLYRFSHNAPRDFVAVLSGDTTVDVDGDARIPIEYQLNRLYVAASRAKSQLIVVDDKDSRSGFWRFAMDPNVTERLLDRVRDRERWSKSLTYLAVGRDGAWAGERHDQRHLAEQYAAQGEQVRDPYLMRQAALAYRGAGDEQESARHFAIATEYEGSLLDAANRYRQLGNSQDAFRCYWAISRYDMVEQLAAADADLQQKLESRTASFLASASEPDLRFVDVFLGAIKRDQWRRDARHDQTWLHAVSSVADRLAKARTLELPWSDIYSSMTVLAADGFAISPETLGHLAFRGRAFEDSVRLLEQAGDTKSQTYYRAMAASRPPAQAVEWLSRLGEHVQILEHWASRRENGLEPRIGESRIAHAIIDAALAESNIEVACQVLRVYTDTPTAAKVLERALASGAEDDLTMALTAVIDVLLANRDWPALVKAADKADFSGLLSVRSQRAAAALGEAGFGDAARQLALSGLASSDALQGESLDRRRPVIDFLGREFVRKEPLFNDRRTPQVVGAAIERAGQIVDAIRFYERLAKDEATEKSVRRFATERWIKNLERAAQYERSKNNNIEASRRETTARDLRVRARFAAKKIAEFPVFAGPAEKTAPNPYQITVSNDHKRVRIENKDRFEFVTVDCVAATLNGDAAVEEVEANGGSLRTWLIPAWPMTVVLQDAGDGFKVEAVSGGHRLRGRVG